MVRDQYTQKKTKKNSRRLCPKLRFSRIFLVQKTSKNNSSNSSTADQHVISFSDTSICSNTVFPSLQYSEDPAVSVSIDFPSNSKSDSPFNYAAYDYSCVDRDDFVNHLRDVLREDIFKLSASLAAAEFWEWVPPCK